MSWLLQISDCHLVAPGDRLLGVDTQASLEAVLTQALAAHTPAAIVASGDLAHDPQVEIYQRFARTVRAHSQAPLLCLPGNHDVLARMQQADLPMTPLALPGWDIVPLDSHQDEVAAAAVTDADLAVTGRYLQQCRQPYTLVVTHHPWLDIDTPWLDKDRIQTPTDLLNWLAARAPDLRGVIFGHAHQEISGQCLQTPLYGVPSTCFQFQPGSQRFSIADAAPGYRWLQLADDGRMATHVGRLANYALNVQLP